jgi:hypothetical protein
MDAHPLFSWSFVSKRIDYLLFARHKTRKEQVYSSDTRVATNTPKSFHEGLRQLVKVYSKSPQTRDKQGLPLVRLRSHIGNTRSLHNMEKDWTDTTL